DMRRRMYSIPQRQAEQVSRRLDAPHAITSATTATPPAVPDAPPATPLPHHHVEEEPMTEVPDYLRAGSRARANKLLVAGLAILVLGTLGFFSFGPNGWLVGKNNAIDSDPQPAPTSGRDGRVAPPGDATAPVAPADTPPLDSDTFPPAGE